MDPYTHFLLKLITPKHTTRTCAMSVPVSKLSDDIITGHLNVSSCTELQKFLPKHLKRHRVGTVERLFDVFVIDED